MTRRDLRDVGCSAGKYAAACGFVTVNYDGETFFVRHAQFCGDDEPYEKLKRALKAEIEEAAWATVYSTTFHPFAPPTTGKIAVKVINRYGDEVLEVYDVPQRRQRGIPGSTTDGLCTLWRFRRWSLMVGRQAADRAP